MDSFDFSKYNFEEEIKDNSGKTIMAYNLPAGKSSWDCKQSISTYYGDIKAYVKIPVNSITQNRICFIDINLDADSSPYLKYLNICSQALKLLSGKI